MPVYMYVYTHAHTHVHTLVHTHVHTHVYNTRLYTRLFTEFPLAVAMNSTDFSITLEHWMGGHTIELWYFFFMQWF